MEDNGSRQPAPTSMSELATLSVLSISSRLGVTVAPGPASWRPPPSSTSLPNMQPIVSNSSPTSKPTLMPCRPSNTSSIDSRHARRTSGEGSRARCTCCVKT